MDPAFWARAAAGPELNFDLCNILSHIYDANPVPNMLAAIPLPYVKPTDFTYLALDTVIPPTVIWKNVWGMYIFCGGTSGSIHVPAMLEGWRDLLSGPDPTFGASPAFARAARQIFNAAGPIDVSSQPNLYLVGHSYGGACMQALSMLVRGNDFQLRGVWSYGSPRPGSGLMASGLNYVQNTRFWNDSDPVRWIPPHSDEASMLGNFGDVLLIQGMNQQVQGPIGYKIDAIGNIIADVGDPTPLSAVSLSIANWCTDANTFRSVLHSAAEYRRRFQLALPLKPGGPAVPVGQLPEQPATVRPREIVAQQEQQMPVIEAALADPASGVNVEIRQLPTPDSALRFKRRRDGGIWVVRYGEDTVDVGPGKRRAGRLARSYNKLVRG